jgi:hypothetical protein
MWFLFVELSCFISCAQYHGTSFRITYPIYELGGRRLGNLWAWVILGWVLYRTGTRGDIGLGPGVQMVERGTG